MISVVCLVTLLVAAPPPPNKPAPPDPTTLPLPAITDAMPFTRLFAHDLQAMSDGDLMALIDQLHSRLFLDDSSTLIETASDLELALRYATAVQTVGARPTVAQGPNAAALLFHTRSAAYLVYTTGYAYESREDVRASVEGFLPPPDAPNRQAVEAMIAAIRTMRFYGNHWLTQVMPAAARKNPNDVGVMVQEGMWLEDEGKPAEAAERYTRALSLQVTDTVALAAYHAFLQVGAPEADAAAATLRGVIVNAYPKLATRFQATLDFAEAVRATASYEANGGQNTLAQSVAQLPRYLALDRPGAADLLAREVLGRFPNEPAAWHAAAETWFLLGRFESLRTFFLDAEQKSMFDARLREVRIAARAKVLLQEALGNAHHPLADGDFEGDLAAFVKAGGGPGSEADLAVRATKVYLAVARFIALRNRAGLAKDDRPNAIAAAEHEIDALLKARPKDPAALTLAVTAEAGLDQPRVALARVSPLVAKLGNDGLGVAFLLARVEAGVALRERDAALMKSALARFAAIDKKLSKATIDKASFVLASVTARLGALAIDGAALTLPQLDDALAQLAKLDGAFDEADADGRALAQAHELTRATLRLMRAKLTKDDADAKGAIDAFRAARAARRDSDLALLAGGVVQWLIGDASGALELYQRAAQRSDRPAITQWLWLGEAQAAGSLGDAATARPAAQHALDEWAAAFLPDTLQPGTVRALFVGDFDLGLQIAAGKPLIVQLRANPVLVLVPELTQGKAETQAFIADIDKAAASQLPKSP